MPLDLGWGSKGPGGGGGKQGTGRVLKRIIGGIMGHEQNRF